MAVITKRLPSDPEIKTFTRRLAVGFALMALVSWVIQGHAATLIQEGRMVWGWQLYSAAVLLGAALVVCRAPRVALPLYYGWMVLGTVASLVVLSAVYYGLVTPVAVWFKLTKRDMLRRRKRPEAQASYWQARAGRPDKNRYLKQF